MLVVQQAQAYLISMLKAFWGEHATADNDFCYDYLPKLDHRDHSHIGLYKYMGEGGNQGVDLLG